LNTHEHYEELCALAASGQVSPDELTDLRSHLENCPSCRGAAYDFTQISAQALSQLAAKRLHCQIPSGMTQRFVARARSEGIEITRETLPKVRSRSWQRLAAGVGTIAAIILIVGFVAIRRHQASQWTIEHEPSLEQQSVRVPSDTSRQSSHAEEAQLERKLATARSEMNSMELSIRGERSELESMRKASDSVNLQLAGVQQENARIQSEMAQQDARIAQLEGELKKAQSEKNASDTALSLREAELSELRKQVADETEALGQQEALAARGSDVRDLVVARNLHIIDVHDRDGNGKSQHAFGRIFYTEGKSLIFYAYDLSDPRKLDARVSFYVWGERLGAEKPIKSLGIFHNDDANDGRWVLTFDDPQVLAQINSVFVTVESSKKSIREPGGQRILFAFLGDKPNHP